MVCIQTLIFSRSDLHLRLALHARLTLTIVCLKYAKNYVLQPIWVSNMGDLHKGWEGVGQSVAKHILQWSGRAWASIWARSIGCFISESLCISWQNWECSSSTMTSWIGILIAASLSWFIWTQTATTSLLISLRTSFAPSCTQNFSQQSGNC